MGAAGVVFALLLAWAVNVALAEPFAIACKVQAHFRLTAGRERRSDKFTSPGERAMRWINPKRGETAL